MMVASIRSSTFVYGLQAGINKLRMWDELGGNRDGWSGPWYMGLFNEFHIVIKKYGVGSSNTIALCSNFILSVSYTHLTLPTNREV